MILGILLIAMVAAAAATLTLFLMSAPLWMALLAYPVTGTVVVFAGLFLWDARARTWLRGNKPTFLSRVTSRFRAGQPPR